jgi:hypothetical protein
VCYFDGGQIMAMNSVCTCGACLRPVTSPINTKAFDKDLDCDYDHDYDFDKDLDCDCDYDCDLDFDCDKPFNMVA